MEVSYLNNMTMYILRTSTVDYMGVPGAGQDQGWVSDDLRQIFEIIFYVILNGAFGVLGSLANFIVIVIFVKQGFKDSVNISLLGLAVSDMCSLLTMIWESVCLNPLFIASEASVSYNDIHYLTSALPHGIFVRIAWWITTFITFERCLCIAMPLKVKQIITPRRTVYIIVFIFAATFLGMSPLIIANRLQPTPLPSSNRTVLARVYIEDGGYIESVGFVYNVVSQFGAFVVDVVCTVTIVRLLRSKSKWRSKTSSGTSATDVAKHGLAARDKKVVKMVTLISVIFLVCLMPSCVNFAVGLVLAPGYSLLGAQRNLFNVIWASILTLEAVNSSVNILVYYNMSTKFKLTFRELFFPDVL